MTSQLQKLITLYERSPKGDKTIDCLVHVSSGDFSFIRKDRQTVLNCNAAELLTFEEIEGIISDPASLKVMAYGENVPHELILRTLHAVRNSPMQRVNVKKAVENFEKKRL